MTGKNKTARIAGLLYLVVVVTGMFSLAYIPKQLFVWNDPAQTLDNMLHHEALFRLSIASSVICYTAFIFLPVALFYLLRSVHEFYAKTMALLAIISVPMSFINLRHKYDILSLLEASRQLHPGTAPELPAQMMEHLTRYDNGILIITVFWGLWLLPFGYLVYRSGFLPRLLGIFLMLGCAGYLVNFFGNTLSGDYASSGVSSYLGMLPAIGEIGTCLWLLVAGVKEMPDYKDKE